MPLPELSKFKRRRQDGMEPASTRPIWAVVDGKTVRFPGALPAAIWASEKLGLKTPSSTTFAKAKELIVKAGGKLMTP